ncbi:Oligosaccharide translocation protein RFT1 [Psilocybe cubensis]|uniref:Man(5)GlcNAc(2)-PP-dolichol translocation protein RFT1 n=2 Tax=Psilocybe cubensis TaxID=181762 RepID=A0A8H7XPM0_PSICU|nr:Oligosaccharide translocation protein RFT1 [Psilocybe cubensis]KAH9477026.1 Oligosaccharide translocation protein RFT1 [Psilocybe cubensis]
MSSSSLVSSLMALQLLSRGATFLLNQALFRLASPAAFGAASIQLELLLGTILFLSREGVRGALLRRGNASNKEKIKRTDPSTTMNLAFLPLIAGIPLALFTTLLYTTYTASQEIRAQPHFKTAVALYAGAAVVELLSEPFYNVAMTELKTGVRLRAEGLGITAKSITTFLVLFYDATTGSGSLALPAFAFGQLAYALVLLGVYAVYFGPGRLIPKTQTSSESRSRSTLFNYIDTETLRLSYTMTLQSLVKHVLTEGDKLVLSYFSPLQDQGGYAIAVNYGSLIARIVFQPIEETVRVFFSKNFGSSSPFPSSTLRSASKTLHTLLSLQLTLSSIFLVFASTYAPLLLPLLLPPAYHATSAPRVLAAWVWYIPVLAVNGGLEAFMASVASAQELNSQSRWMVAFSFLYILSAITLYRTGFGDTALVYANILNLSARIVYTLRFASRFFDAQESASIAASKSTPTSKYDTPSVTPSPSSQTQAQLFNWRTTLPPLSLLTVLAISAVVIRLSARRLGLDISVSSRSNSLPGGKLALLLSPPVLIHIALGGALGLLCLFTWWRSTGRDLVASFTDARKVKSKAA